jgi:hypothetical protein
MNTFCEKGYIRAFSQQAVTQEIDTWLASNPTSEQKETVRLFCERLGGIFEPSTVRWFSEEENRT